jgi:cytochrome b561
VLRNSQDRFGVVTTVWHGLVLRDNTLARMLGRRAHG